MVLRWVGFFAVASVGITATEAAAPHPLSFSCNALPGEVSGMDGQLPASTAITGNLRALQMRHDSNVRPVATVRLASEKDFVALQITPTEPNSDTFTVFVRNGDSKVEERIGLGEVSLNQTMPFAIARNGKDVVVSASGQTVSIRQPFRGSPVIGVSCTTGYFLFDNVRVQ
jgi:hypothetical protein